MQIKDVTQKPVLRTFEIKLTEQEIVDLFHVGLELMPGPRGSRPGLRQAAELLKAFREASLGEDPL
jgi:hypothetical protein